LDENNEVEKFLDRNEVNTFLLQNSYLIAFDHILNKINNNKDEEIYNTPIKKYSERFKT